MISQQTLQSPITLHGRGIHMNQPTSVTINPAPADHGIVLMRSDLFPTSLVAARASEVSSTQLNTTLGAKPFSIGTVEHLLAALSGMGIDNALIEIDGPEIPILDGSSHVFVAAIKQAGCQSQLASRKFLVIDRPVHVRSGKSMAQLSPSSSFSADCTIDFPHPLIGKQRFEMIVNPMSFAAEIGPARTFGFLHEAHLLRKRGLGFGAGLENCIVLNENEILNAEGLRFSNEFVRHKVLDALGDLSLLGLPILGKLMTIQGGHSIHFKLVQALLSQPSAWHIADASQDDHFFFHPHQEDRFFDSLPLDIAV